MEQITKVLSKEQPTKQEIYLSVVQKYISTDNKRFLINAEKQISKTALEWNKEFSVKLKDGTKQTIKAENKNLFLPFDADKTLSGFKPEHKTFIQNKVLLKAKATARKFYNAE